MLLLDKTGTITLGNRQASQLQGVGQIEWLLYGSGHVHGL